MALAYRAADAFNRHDLEAFLALCDPDLEFYSRLAAVEGGGPYQGHDGIRTWWENLHGAWRDFSLGVQEVRDLGDVTLTYLRLRGRGMDSDAPWEQAQWHVVEWRNEGHPVANLPERGRSPRSRRAVGIAALDEKQ